MTVCWNLLKTNVGLSYLIFIQDGCDLIFRSKLVEEPRSYKGLGDDQLGLDEDEERDDHLLPM